MIKLKKSISNSVLADAFGVHLKGEVREITNIASLDDGNESTLCFAKGDLQHCLPVSTVIMRQIPSNTISDHPCIFHSKPRLLFVRALIYLIHNNFLEPYKLKHSVSKSATIHDSAVIEFGCEIGDYVQINAGAVIKSGVKLGAGAKISENVVIGSEGFGFERDESGIPVQFPHLCGVEIGANVLVAPNTVISRGALKNTVVEDNAVINSNVLIGHHVWVGRATYVHAGAVLSGGARIGENCWVGTNATVLQKISVENNCIIGSGSVVNRDVSQSSIVAGVPAKLVRKVRANDLI